MYRKDMSLFNMNTAPDRYSEWSLSLYCGYYDAKPCEDTIELDLTYDSNEEHFECYVNPYEYVALMENGLVVKFLGEQKALTMEGSYYGLMHVSISLYSMINYMYNMFDIDIENEPKEATLEVEEV